MEINETTKLKDIIEHLLEAETFLLENIKKLTERVDKLEKCHGKN